MFSPSKTSYIYIIDALAVYLYITAFVIYITFNVYSCPYPLEFSLI